MTTIKTISGLKFVSNFKNGLEIFTPLFATGLHEGEKAIFDGITIIKETVFDENTEEWVEVTRDYKGVIRQINSDDMIQYKCCIEYYNFKMECLRRDYFGFGDEPTKFSECDIVVIVTEFYNTTTTRAMLASSVDEYLEEVKAEHEDVKAKARSEAKIQAANEKAAEEAANEEFIFSDADKKKVLDFLKSNKANAKQIHGKTGISCDSFEALQGLKALAKKGIIKEDYGKFYL